jgi:hypothetical protein
MRVLWKPPRSAVAEPSRWLRLTFSLVSLLCVGCSLVPEPSRSEPRAFEGRGFSATIRRDVLSNEDSPTQGVTLYDFHVGSLPLLFVYAGDDAGYPHFSWAADREEHVTLHSGLSAHCRYAEADQGRARECLIELSKRSPKQLLVFYEKLSPKWAGVADAIIDSIRARKL